MSAGEPDYSSLSVGELISHSNWRARVHGYEQLTKAFSTEADEQSALFSTYMPSLKELLADKHANAILPALDMAAALFDRADAKIVLGGKGADVQAALSAAIATAFTGRPMAKSKAADLCKLCVEIGGAEYVVAALLDGVKSTKNGKLPPVCLAVLAEIVRDFGAKPLPVRALLKELPPLFDKTDEGVRREAQNLAAELYRWGLGTVLAVQLKDIRPAQLKSLQQRYDDIDKEDKPVPARLLRSQNPEYGGTAPSSSSSSSSAAAAAAASSASSSSDDTNSDPYYFVDPVPFADGLDEAWQAALLDKKTKWTDKRDALEAVIAKTSCPRLAAGSYGDLMKTLRQVIDTDVNQIVVEKAVLLVRNMVHGLRLELAKEAKGAVATLLNKFKDKKAPIVTACSEALDACVQRKCFAVLDVQKDIVAALNNKTPSINHQTILWLHRTIQSSPHDAVLAFAKFAAHCFVELGLTNTAPEVRNAAAEAFGLLLGRVGEKTLAVYFHKLDAVKQKKVKQCIPEQSSPPAPAPAPAPTVDASPAEPVKSSSAARARPAASRPAASRSAASARAAPVDKPAVKAAPRADVPPPSVSVDDAHLLNIDEAHSRLVELGFDGQLLDSLAAAKDIPGRARCVQQLVACVDAHLSSSAANSELVELLLCLLAHRPGWKDSDPRVLEPMLSFCQRLVGLTELRPHVAFYLFDSLLAKAANPKLDKPIANTLFALAENLTPHFVFDQLCQRQTQLTNFKVVAFATQWLAQCIRDFGAAAVPYPKLVLRYLKQQLSSPQNLVRDATVAAMCSLVQAVPQAKLPTADYLLDVKPPALLTRLEKSLQQALATKPPAPVRFIRGQSSTPASSIPTPTIQPIVQPTIQPIVQPTIQPIVQPTIQPIVQPTIQPVQRPVSPSASSSLFELLKSEGLVAPLTNPAADAEAHWQALNRLFEALQLAQYARINAQLERRNLNNMFALLRGQLLAAAGSRVTALLLRIVGAFGRAVDPRLPEHVEALFGPLFQLLGGGDEAAAAEAARCLDDWTQDVELAALLPLLAELLAGSAALHVRQIDWLMVSARLPAMAARCEREQLSPFVKPALAAVLPDDEAARERGTAFLRLVLKYGNFDVFKKEFKTFSRSQGQRIQPIVQDLRRALAKESHQSAATPGQPAPAVTSSSSSSSSSSTTMVTKESREQAFRQHSSESLLHGWPADGRKPSEQTVFALANLVQAVVPASLYSAMFAADAQQRMQALSSVAHCGSLASDFLPQSDLYFLWTVTVSFSSSESVRVAAVEAIKTLVRRYETDNVVMSDLDAASFLPYLLYRSDDDVPELTGLLQDLVRPLCAIYPRSKVFAALLEAVQPGRAPSARRRAVYLQILTDLLRRHGLSILVDPSLTYSTVGALIEAGGAIADKALEFFFNARAHSPDPDVSFWPLVATLLPKKQLEAVVNYLRTPVVAASPSKSAARRTSSGPSIFPPETPSVTSRYLPMTPFAAPSTSSASSVASPRSPASPQSIESWVWRLQRADESPDCLIETMKYVCIALDNADNDSVFAPLADALVQGLDSLLDEALSPDASTPPSSRFCKYLVNTLLYVFRRAALAAAVTGLAFKPLLRNALLHLSRVDWDSLLDGDFLRKAFNMLILRMLENARQTLVVATLVDLLAESGADDSLYIDFVMQCLLTVINRLPDTVALMDDLSSVMLAIHGFLTAHPPSKFRSSTGTKMPLKIIRAILNELVSAKGAAIYEHLILVPSSSPLPIIRSYIDAMLQRAAKAESTVQDENSGPSASSDIASLARRLHAAKLLLGAGAAQPGAAAETRARWASISHGLSAAASSGQSIVQLKDKLAQLRS